MNLSEVLNVALPELPARRIERTYLRLHPNLIAREQVEGGVPTIVAMVSGGLYTMRFRPEQWKLLQLFDGKRSYGEVAEVFREETGVILAEKELREFTDSLEEGGIWYRTSLETATTSAEKLADERRRRTRKRIDLAMMTFSTWDPDKYLTRLHTRLGFIYTKWFTLLTLGMFAVMVLIFVSGWSEIWRDTVQYYTFTDKNAADLAEFWLLFCGLGYFHECAHGLTCKHFGGAVHRMGFVLVYLSPAFFCDISEIYVYGGKWTRIAGIIAGIWVELMFCSVASIVWWLTPAGIPIHDFAYKVMLITGVAVVLMNLNPLIKLDGYYLFGELIGVPAIKENSTEYVSSLVKRHVFRLPVEVPYLRPGRRGLFMIYAVVSGLYSYLILFAVVRFVYNIFTRSNPQWGFLPALLLAVLILRSRLRSSVRFMKDFFLDKRQRLRTLWNRPSKAAAVGVIAALVLFAPIWPQVVSGRFVLEPHRNATIRAALAGQITEVLADEGTPVAAGTPLFLLRNARLEAEAAEATFHLRTAEAKARAAQMNYTDLGVARAERALQADRSRSAAEQLDALRVASPISGVIATPRLRSRVGTFVKEGDLLADVEDDSALKARIFIPESEVHWIRSGAAVSLKLESQFQPVRGHVASLAPASSELAGGLSQQEKYKGIAPPVYYVVTVPVSNARGMLRSGMSGDAKIHVKKQSIFGFVWSSICEIALRKLW